MQRTRVKICGITRSADAALAVELGADAIGFVFVSASKRYIEVAAAAEIAKELPAFVTRVGLFLDDDSSVVKSALAAMPELLPQFHGKETPRYCEQFGRSYLKAIGVADGMPASAELTAYTHACGFLYDSHAPGELGGTGHAFDWQQLQHTQPRPLILAVSSGVESSKGIKDHGKLKAFMRAVHTVSPN